VSGSADTTGLVWDTAGLTTRAAPPRADIDVERRWADMAGDDAAAAYDAVWALSQVPERSVPFLAGRLRPAAAADARRVAALVADLDNDSFEVREKAARELEALGESARAGLMKALPDAPSLGVRRRVGQLLERLDGTPTGDALRALRAVEVLEHADNAEARALLDKLANGAPEARLTQDAKAARDRLRGSVSRP
jgi:hypothetical protein